MASAGSSARCRRRRREPGGRVLSLGRGLARLGATRPAQRSQAARRPTIATHQPRAQHRAHLRSGAKPGDHHHCGHQERRRSRRRRDADRRAITVKELAERFEKEHLDLRLKPSTAKGYKRMMERFVIAVLSNHRVTEETRADIAKVRHDLRHVAYDANRCLEMISKMLNLAEMWGLRPDGSNPRKHIKKYPEEKRERFLSPAGLRRVGEVLREMESDGIELPSSISAARLLILTGCRLGEILTLQWEHVDIAGKALRLPDSKTGAQGRASRSASGRGSGKD